MNPEPSIRVAHISDTHIGYEAYRAVSANGENQRGEDIVRAFHRAVQGICEWDPPLVVHSGDIAERPAIPIRHMLFIRSELTKLAAVRPDGSRRQVVVIAGNHDLAAHRREPCFLELFSDIPGVHIVTDRLRVIEFTSADSPDELRNVAVTALPHDTLKEFAIDARFDEVTPRPDRTNILVAHGVAGGSGLYRRTIGREYAIPTEVLGRPWAYVALGHWHKQGPIHVTDTGNRDKGTIWYAGSTENMGFGDVTHGKNGRGWLQVNIVHGRIPDVTPVVVPGRPMLRVDDIDGAGLDAASIAAQLTGNVRALKRKNLLAGAVVAQIVRNVPREIWALVDTTTAKHEADSALHYEIAVEPVRAARNEQTQDGSTGTTTVGGLDAFIDILKQQIIGSVVPGDDQAARDEVLTAATAALSAQMRFDLTETDGDTADRGDDDR